MCIRVPYNFFQGRIVNNNTVPVSSSSASFHNEAPEVQNNNNNNRDDQEDDDDDKQTQFLIHEEGGLERWFNLTILNVDLPNVGDYTCVAVNAGGVMEENIALTFEEPEPVGQLPGSAQETSAMTYAIGAVSGGILFVFVLLFVACCCCRNKKQPPGSKKHHHHHHDSDGGDAGVVDVSAENNERKKSSMKYAAENALSMLPPEEQFMDEEVIIDDYNVRYAAAAAQPIQPQSRNSQRAPRVVGFQVGGSSSSDSGPGSPPVHHHHQQQQQQPQHPRHVPDLLPKNSKVRFGEYNQPLNPASLQKIPLPPANAGPVQFPHQFPHLIHPSQSFENQILSPPAQFTQNEAIASYVTLPRSSGAGAPGANSRPLQPPGSGQHVDWSSFKKNSSIYDGVGPRTTATGSTAVKDRGKSGGVQFSLKMSPCSPIREETPNFVST